jgi:hypothetical protein
MKYLILIITLFSNRAFAQAWVPAKTGNPITAYTAFHQLKPGRIIYKWEVDLSNDGRKEVLLDTKETPAELAQEVKETQGNMNENVRTFTVYIPNPSGSGYTESRGLDEGDNLGVSPGATEVDVTQCYVGYITQLRRWGLVTIRSDDATDKVPAEARIYSYTIDGDHLKSQLLAKYNPTKGTNAIYNQYLSKSKRTKVQLQEVTP